MRQLWENLNNSPQQTSFNSSVILWCCHCFVLFCCKSQTFLVKVSCCLDFFSKISGISLNCYLNSSNTASLQKGSYKPRWSLLHASQSRFFLNKISSLHFFPPDVVVCILPKDLEHWTFRTLISNIVPKYLFLKKSRHCVVWLIERDNPHFQSPQ